MSTERDYDQDPHVIVMTVNLCLYGEVSEEKLEELKSFLQDDDDAIQQTILYSAEDVLDDDIGMSVGISDIGIGDIDFPT